MDIFVQLAYKGGARLKNAFCATVGFFGAAMMEIFGGWSIGLELMLTLMALDFVTGLIDAIMGLSTKSESGYLSSKQCIMGVFRKIYMLILLAVSVKIGRYLDMLYLQKIVMNAYIVSEAISLLENMASAGVPIPKAITDAIDLLKGKIEEETENEHH